MGTANFRPFIPVDPHPAKPVEDFLDGVVDMPFLVGVVDSQEKLAAVMPGQQPVEECCPDSADVQETGRTGSKSGTNSHGAFSRQGRRRKRKTSLVAAGNSPAMALRRTKMRRTVGLESKAQRSPPARLEALGDERIGFTIGSFRGAVNGARSKRRRR